MAFHAMSPFPGHIPVSFRKGVGFIKLLTYLKCCLRIVRMKYIKRTQEAEIRRAANAFSATILTGPRRSGKTTMLRHCFPDATYVLLEEPDVIDSVRNDPRSFLEELGRPAILDEIQNTPELLNYIRAEIDASPERKGVWLLTVYMTYLILQYR